MSLITGVLEKISQRHPRPGMTMWNIRVEGKEYGHGPFPVKGLEEGDRIQFEVEMRGNFPNVKHGTLKKYEPKIPEGAEEVLVVGPPLPATPGPSATVKAYAASHPVSRDDYWAKKEIRDIEKEKRWETREEDKQKRITFDSSRKAAMEYVALLASTESLWLKKMDKAKDRMEYVEGLVNDLTRKFYKQAEARDQFLSNQSLFDEDLSKSANPPPTAEHEPDAS